MITFNRIPSHLESATWKKSSKKTASSSEEEQGPDFEDMFQAVSENSEISPSADRKPEKIFPKTFWEKNKNRSQCVKTLFLQGTKFRFPAGGVDKRILRK